MNKQRTLAAAALTLGLASANAELVTINFETLAPGTVVTSQFAAQGIRFSSSPVLAYEQGSFRTNALALSTGAITLTFDSDISNFSVVMRDTDGGSLLGRVRAFNALGYLMGHMTDFTGHFNTSWFYENTLSVNVGGIRYVELTSDADGVIIDNITFTRVPTPGALALLPLGLLAIGKRKR